MPRNDTIDVLRWLGRLLLYGLALPIGLLAIALWLLAAIEIEDVVVARGVVVHSEPVSPNRDDDIAIVSAGIEPQDIDKLTQLWIERIAVTISSEDGATKFAARLDSISKDVVRRERNSSSDADRPDPFFPAKFVIEPSPTSRPLPAGDRLAPGRPATVEIHFDRRSLLDRFIDQYVGPLWITDCF